MSRIYKVKNPPAIVRKYYHKVFDCGEANYEFDYYWYFGMDDRRIWGCMVTRNGTLYDYSHQLHISKMEEFLTN